MTTKIDLTGQTFGRWTVLNETPKTRPGATLWRCQCACGKIKDRVLYNSLTRGTSTSCGCSRRVGGTRNRHNPTYRSWIGMKTRCLNLNHPSSLRYGQRGITICPEWLNDFGRFKSDMGERPEGKTLDRINSSLGYSKSNCQWSDRMTQSRNRRTTLWQEWEGQRLCLTDVARAANVDYPQLRRRVLAGANTQQAIKVLRQENQAFFDRRTGNKTTQRRVSRRIDRTDKVA